MKRALKFGNFAKKARKKSNGEHRDMNKQEALKKYFGHSEFREGQAELIDAIMAGQDALGIMPTGAGKSVCYQIPAVLSEGVTVVISPLISLMKDQVNALNQMGIRAAYLNSSLTERQFRIALARAYEGQYKIIYIAPERLETEGFMRLACSIRIAILAVDEAHCISQWGQDFRPSYVRIRQFIDALPYRPVLAAFTATATYKVKDDIVRILGLNRPYTVTTGFDRKNLYFGVEHPKDKMTALMRILKQQGDKSGIVYCTSRKNVEEVCDKLRFNGFSATRYHAGLEDEERRVNQDDFLFDRHRIMVATNAFGMGIDKSNVSFVIHYNMPKDIESYYQEAGRAGRDGESAECILLYSKTDYHTIKYFIEHPSQNEELTEEQRKVIKEHEYERLRQMTFYSTTDKCLRQFILDYFGDRRPCECGNCSSCLPERRVELRGARPRYSEDIRAEDRWKYVPEPPVRKAAAQLTKEDEPLFAVLKEIRRIKANALGIPAFTIFSDASLRDMCAKKPITMEEFMDISGVGEVKAKKYGKLFMDGIKRYLTTRS